MEFDRERRFGGVARLYGEAGAKQLAAAHVCVVGIGGVGSWAVEALARSGIGALTLIDLDMVAESNTNRQVHALGDDYGKAKVDVMATRILAIHPACQVAAIEDFVTVDNVTTMLGSHFDHVIDAIDQVRTKAAMIAHCQRMRIPIVTAGAAGGKLEPTRIAICDLARTEQDPLLAKVRSQLRREYGFTRRPRDKFGVAAIYSDEPLRPPAAGASCATTDRPTGLGCTGFGSSICVTASFGLAAASHVIRAITNQ